MTPCVLFRHASGVVLGGSGHLGTLTEKGLEQSQSTDDPFIASE